MQADTLTITLSAVVSVLILIVSVMLHELAHGYTALYYGDTTALDAGRLSLNPIRHMDLFGSCILPILLIISGSPIVLGWAKPVPISVSRLRTPYAYALVAIAGPLSNLLLAFLVSMAVRILGTGEMYTGIISVLYSVVVVNCVLMLFNLIPLPPLDGFHVLSYFIGVRSQTVAFLERYGLVLLIAVIFLFDRFLQGPLFFIVSHLTGIY